MDTGHAVRRRVFALLAGLSLLRGKRWQRGQLVVEAAILIPVLLGLVLATVESGLLVAAYADQGRRTAVLADWAASHDARTFAASWDGVVAVELPDCTVTIDESGVDLITVSAVCQYAGRVVPSLVVPMSTDATASVADASPSPSPSPAESGDPS